MKTYRLHTQDLNLDGIKAIADSVLKGYTIYNTTGRFDSVNESSIVIEVIGDDDDGLIGKLLQVAYQIKELNSQLEVWLTEYDVRRYIV